MIVGNEMLVFGGIGTTGIFLQDLWGLNLSNEPHFEF